MTKETINTKLAIEYLVKIVIGLATLIYFFFTDRHDHNLVAYHVHDFFCFPDFVFEVASFIFSKTIAYIILFVFWLLAWTGIYIFSYPILDLLMSKFERKN